MPHGTGNCILHIQSLDLELDSTADMSSISSSFSLSLLSVTCSRPTCGWVRVHKLSITPGLLTFLSWSFSNSISSPSLNSLLVLGLVRWTGYRFVAR